MEIAKTNQNFTIFLLIHGDMIEGIQGLRGGGARNMIQQKRIGLMKFLACVHMGASMYQFLNNAFSF